MGSDDPLLSAYRGRFAPSPTGPLHFGSLVAATASYLQALVHKGIWLLRIEDLDPPREDPDADERIIRALDAHAFRWHGTILRQSENLGRYYEVASQLLSDGLAYRCTCSREDIRRTGAPVGPAGMIYPGTCRNADHVAAPGSPDALRLRTDQSIVNFDDALQGRIRADIEMSIGDFIIRRKDGLIAYSLAVVIDDADEEITEIVRGCDLLDITPAQIRLQQVLGLATPTYMHIPVVTNDRDQKLSKQHGAGPIDDTNPGTNLIAALKFLRQEPPEELKNAPVTAIWDWAVEHWKPGRLAAKRQLQQNSAQ